MENMATDTERACDDDELVNPCDGCGGVLEPWDDDDSLVVIYYCFHALHAGCADGRDTCPRCHTPRRVHDDDDCPPEQLVDEATPASPPPDDNSPDEDSALSRNDGGETGEPRASRCDGGDSIKHGNGKSPASMSGCRVAELEGRLDEKSAAVTETTNVVLESELERAQSRICRLEKMYKLEEFIRFRDGNGKRAREIEDAEERKGRSRGRSVSSFPQDD